MSGRRLLQKPISPSNPAQLVIGTVNTSTGTSATSHNVTVAPNSLLVLSTGMNLGGGIAPLISSTPNLTWTKRVDSDGASGSAEIWTAFYAAGGSITVTSNWGNGRFQSSALYAILNAENPPGGASAIGVQQVAPSVNITTTRTNSLLIAITSDWNAETDPVTYRGTPIQTHYSYSGTDGALYHYYYTAPTQMGYTVGMTSPADFDGKGTAVLEIRRLNTGGSSDTTPPSAPVLSSPSHGVTTIDILWTTATDNIGVIGYDIYLNSALHATVTGTSYNFSGLTASTMYNIVVRSKDAAGNTTPSNTVVVTTNAPAGDTTPPSAPVLSSPSNSTTTINLSWTASTDNVAVTGYEIYLDNILQTTVTTLNHTLSGLTQNTLYSIRVRAKDGAGNGTNSNTISVLTDASSGGGSAVPFSLTEIPYSDPDIITYGRGAEQWHYPCTNSTGCPSSSGQWDRISNPTTANAQWTENSLNVYHRFQWTQIEGATQGSYNWAFLDQRINDAISRKQMISFGIMTFYDDPPGGDVSYDNGRSSYPLYVHTAMQAGAANTKDWKTDGSGETTAFGRWVPNWNHPFYISALRTLHTAIRTYLLNTFHTNGTRYADAVFCIDIRGYGNYGEWHTGGICDWNNYPTGRAPSAQTLIDLIKAHTEIFDQWPLVMMVAGYNALPGGSTIPLFHSYPTVAHYALDATNAWGQVGYRRDQVVATDGYLVDLLSGNDNQLNGTGLTVAQKFLNLYKTAPGTGEPLPGAFDNHDTSQIDANIQLYHHASFGNGNWPGGSITAADNTSTKANNVRAGFKRCGFRIKITTGEAPQSIVKGSPFTIKTNWVNVGVACVYEDWNVTFELQTGAGTPVWSGISNKILKLFRPDQGTVQTTDAFTVPVSVPNGVYKLVVKVKDPKGYKDNLKLANQPLNADTSYTIFNNVTVNAAP